MLQICRSNRVETLLDLLAHRLGEAPLASLFTPETVVTPSPAMARWVHLGLAGAHGVAANLVYPLPASFVWQLARDLLVDTPEADPLGIALSQPLYFRARLLDQHIDFFELFLGLVQFASRVVL